MDPNVASRSNNEEAALDRDLERLTTDVMEMVLKSPTEKTLSPAATKLSATAPEFVPSWMRPSEQATNAAGDGEFANEPVVSPEDLPKYLLADVRMYLRQLHANPAGFEDQAYTILSLLNLYCCYDEKLVSLVVDEIFDAGLHDGNFSYQCARLCAFLSENFYGYAAAVAPGQASAGEPSQVFKNVLLGRCKREYEKLIHGSSQGVYEYALFLADLYNQMKTQGKTINVVGDAVLSVINKLLDDPNTCNVACAVRVLHVCGAALEMSEREKFGGGEAAQSTRLDAAIKKFELLLHAGSNAYDLSDDAKHLVKNLLQNRGDWIRYSSQPEANAQEQEAAYHQVSNDTVYFGPDGKPLSAEEAAFLERELGALNSSSSEEEAAFACGYAADDDYPDEDYEAFLRMTEAKKRQQRLK